MTRWDLSQEHKIGSKNPLMRYTFATEQRMKITRTSLKTEKRIFKNPMNIHNKIL